MPGQRCPARRQRRPTELAWHDSAVSCSIEGGKRHRSLANSISGPAFRRNSGSSRRRRPDDGRTTSLPSRFQSIRDTILPSPLIDQVPVTVAVCWPTAPVFLVVAGRHKDPSVSFFPARAASLGTMSHRRPVTGARNSSLSQPRAPSSAAAANDDRGKQFNQTVLRISSIRPDSICGATSGQSPTAAALDNENTSRGADECNAAATDQPPVLAPRDHERPFARQHDQALRRRPPIPRLFEQREARQVGVRQRDARVAESGNFSR